MLFYLKIGPASGKPIVFLHGFLGSYLDFLEVAKEQERPCLLFDLFREEPAPSFPQILESLKETLAKTGYESFDLVGYSMGGRIALCLYSEYPDLFDQLILISAHTGLKTLRARKNHKKWHDEWLKQFSSDDFIDKWYDQPLFKSLKESPHFSTLKERRFKKNLEHEKKIFEELSLLKQPSYPLPQRACLIAGDLDLKYKTLYQCLANTLEIIEGAGHALHIEAPNKTAKAIKTLLNRSHNGRLDTR